MFAIVDIETCGPKFAYQKGRIIDICILVHDGISVTDKFSTLINPECHISGFYTNLSGITNEMVQDAPTFPQVAKDILQYTEGKIFVAHNAAFDYHFIRDEFASLGYTFRRETLCTVKLSRKLMPGKLSYSLGRLCASLGIEIQNRHRAEGDAVATGKLLDLLLQLKTQSREYKSTPLARIMSSRTEQLKKYILDKIPETCGVYYFLDQQKKIVYIGKSVNMYQRALSHYNTDTKKSRQMLYELHDVDFVETGSELISLLMESEEIKRHQPLYNRQRKKDVFTHNLIWFTDEEGIIHFQIKAYEEESGTLLSFVHYASARETLERWMEAHELCQRYCGLSESTSACFHYQIRKCRGICAGQEDVAVYNQRAIELIRQHTYVHPDFIILDRGRRAGEHAFILILNYAYQGYGYLDEQDRISDVDELKSYLHIRQVHPDDDAIIRSWMKQKNPVIRILKK